MNGTIKTAGQVDTYSFALVGGFAYEFDLFGQGSGSGTLAGASLNIVGNSPITEGADGDARITYTAPSSGTYQLRVSANGSNTGTYSLVQSPPDDIGDTNATAGKLTVGGSTTGTIQPVGDDDLFAITLAAGYAYQFDLLGQGAGGGTLSGATLQLFTIAGSNVKATQSSTGDAQISYTANASGTYYLDVADAGSTGSYTLTAQAADDVGDTNATAGKLTVGGSTTGTIQPVGDDDLFAITLAAGYAYQFDLLGQGAGGGTLSGATLQLFTIAGSNVKATQSSTGDAQISYTANVSGIYYLDVADAGSTGSYTLTAQAADDVGDTNATAGKLTVGGSTTGTIQPVGDDDLFAITLAAGYAYQFDLLGQGAGGGTLSGATLQLFTIAGSNVKATQSSTGDAQISYTANVSGIYYLDVADAGSTGSYTLTAQAADDVGDTNATAGKLTVGGSTTGTIQPVGDDDLFAITLAAGYAYQFDLLGQGAGGGTLSGATLQLFTIAGSNVKATQSSTGDAQISYTANVSGIYYLDVADAGSTGSYTLTAQAADDVGDTNATAGKLTVGGSTTGTIQPVGDDDLFAITLAAGYAYQFDLLGQGAGGGTLSGATLQLFTIAGSNVKATQSSTGDAQISYTANVSGIYYLDVADAGSTGSYTLTAQAADDVGDTNATAGKLTVGGSTTGTIQPVGDDDLFAITLAAGYAYQFDLLGQGAGGGTLSGATLQLFTIAGSNVKATQSSTGDAQISYTANVSGIYYLDVADAGSTGSYTLTAAAVVTWKTGISGDWSTAADWSTNAVPGSTNAVTIATSGTYTVTVSVPEAARALNLATPGAVLQVNAKLSIANGLTASQGAISIAAGQVLALSSALSLGANGFNGPTIDGPGEISTSAPTTLVAQQSSGFRDLLLGGGITWINTGTVTDAGLIKFGVGANDTVSLVNQAGGIFDLKTDDADLIASASTDTATLSNAGTLEKTGGTGTSTIAAAVTNTGTIAITTGTLLLSGGLVNNGVLHAFAGGTLDVSGPVAGSGNVVIDQGATVEIGATTSEAVAFTGAGTLQLDAPATFTGTIYGFTPGAKIVLGGTQVTGISVSGSSLTATLAGGGSYTLSIDGLKSASGLTLANNVLTGTAALVSTAPDLVVSNVSTPATAVAGLPITLTWTDTNQGAVTASGPWVDQVFLVSDAAGDNAQLVGSLEYDGALTGSQAIARTLTVTVPAATAGNEYFLIKADALNQVANDGVGPERQGISGAVDFIPTTIPVTPVSISQITPSSGSDLGNVTVTVTGVNFNANDQVTIVGSGQTFTATQVFYVSSGKLWATFNLTSLPVGTYRVQVGDAASTATSPGTFQVNSNPAGTLSVNLVLPTTTSASKTPTGTVTYTNTGATDIAAPLLDVSSTQALLKAPGDTTGSSTLEFLGTNPTGPAGILQPGASGTYSFTYAPTALTLTGNVTVSVGAAQTSTAIDWASQEAALKPATVDATDWHNVYTQFEVLVGTTTDSLDAALSRAASELSQVGQSTNDVAALLQYELFLASGALAGGTLAAATDIAATSSPLSLSLGRLYDGTLLDRDATGSFGDGWTSTYDVRSVTDTSGNVTIQSPGALHVFTRQTNGTYAAQSGDPASLTVSSGLYRMNDGAGDTLQFNTAGQLAGITDANGNLTSLTYGSSGVLQRVSSQAIGETITLTSNTAGRITSATDSNGQTVTYTYDTTNTLLLSATGPAGTTTYTYASVTKSAQDNALTSRTTQDGAQQLFTYDAQGRLASQISDDGTRLVTYNYGSPGAVTVTDAETRPRSCMARTAR